MKSLQVSEGREIPLEPWCLMGIVNATPDSFSDGGRHLDPALAVSAALQMVEEGATIIDVGGESTRPGADRIDAQEQIRRVVPVIEGLRSRSEVAISIDTTLAAVAEAAFNAGANLVNDVAAGLEDPDLLPLIGARGGGVVLMHRLRPPGDDRYSHEYDAPPAYEDLLQEVSGFLEARSQAAEDAGVSRSSIAIDPGLGFGKTVEQNLQLIRGLGEFARTGRPVLVGGSRKSFLGAIAGIPDPEERGAVSVALGIDAWRRGASILRVHDPRPHREALAVAAAVDGSD